MGYRHFGKIGDIWKHLPLCEVIQNENITTYVETNSAYFDYQLTHSDEQNYGIGWFLKNAHRKPSLRESAFFKLLKPLYDKNIYLGSCGQAMQLLSNKVEEYIFYDLDKEALNSIRKGADSLGLLNKVEMKLTDSATGLIKLIPNLSENAFVHIDPYVMHQPNNDGYSYLDGFVEASRKGIKCFLWYGFETLADQKEIDTLLIAKLQEESITFSCDELILKEIQEDSIPFNPGVLGCGILTSNLTKKSIDRIKEFASSLVDIYQEVEFKGVSGALYHDEKLNQYTQS